METKFERLAMNIFFNGGNIEELLRKNGLALREGKTNSDFVKAFRDGIEQGGGKFEREMMFAGKKLAKVCKEQA
jgi:hypothetical protein